MDIATLAMKIDTSDVERADSALDRLGDKGAKAEQAAKSVGDAYQQAGSKLGAAASAAIEAGEAFSRGANSTRSQARELADLIAKIDPATAAMKRLGDQQEQLSRFNLSGMLDGEQYKRLSGLLDEQRTALARSGDAMKLAGISAGQYAQAMRMLPMQLTDVATSLASGMPLWMVAIQQGGQVRDSFGGISNAAKAVLSAIGPTTLALGGVGAVLGGVAAAYYAGTQESSRFNEALIFTGNYAGKTAGELADLASKMDAMSGVTHSSAAEALTQVAASGKFAGDQIELVATAAEQMRVATGKSIEETIGEFAKLSGSPISAILDLNDKYHFLTQSQLDQVQALKEQGKHEEAATAAMKVYADTIAERAPLAVENLGWIERKWRDLKKVAAEAVDGALDIGRAPGTEKQITDLQQRIAYLKSTLGSGYEPLADTAGEVAKLEAQLDLLTKKKAENKTVDSDAAKAAQQYLDSLKAQSIQVQDLSYREQALQKLKSIGIDSSSEQGKQILAEADNVDRLKTAKEAETKAERDAEQAKRKSATTAENAAKRLKEYLGQSSIAAGSADAMAKAYFAGADSVRELTLQQKVEQELLKTGAGARDEVTAAVKRQQDALDRLDLGKRYADLKLDTDQLRSQAVATLAGVDALQAFNAQKMLSVALAGKNADALGAESQQLLEQIKLNQDAAKQVEMANRANSIMDRLYPQQKLLREYTEDQKALGEAMAIDKEHADQWRAALERLGVEYEANKKAGTAWGQWTVSALERVDSAFADAWKNIGGGFKSFRTSLTDAFRQMLAELAHMAITKPIVLSIGVALGIGGSQQALANGGSGIWGMLSGSGSSSGGLGSLLSYGQSAYNVLTGVGPAALAGYQSGGVMGGLSGIGSYYGNMLSNAYSSVAGWFGAGSGAAASSAASAAGSTGFGYGSSLVNGGIGSASYAGSAASSASSLSSSLSTVGTGLAAVGSALAIYNSYQQNSVKGALVTGGATALGAVFGGPIGAAIGSAAGNWVSGKLFGGSWQTKDSGLALQVQRGDLLEYSYQYQKKKGGLFGGGGSRYRYAPLGAAQAAPLEEMFASTISSVEQALESLGLSVSDSALRGLNVGIKHFSAKSKDVEAQISKWFGGVADKATALLAGRNRDLAGLSFDEVSALATALQQVNGSFESLHQTLLDVSPASAKLAKQLQDLAGGADKLTALQGAYYSAYFTDAEKAADLQRNLLSQFADLGMSMPTTISGFRALVEAQDMTTQSGQQAYLSLLTLAPQLQQLYQSLNAVGTAAAQVRADALNSLTDAYSRESNALTATAQSFDTLVGLLRDFRGELDQTIVAAGSQVMQLSAARRQFDAVSARALSGDQQAMGDLPAVGRQLAQAAQASAGSREEYVRALASIKAVTAQAEASAAGKRDVALEQLGALQQQLTALGVLNQSVLSVADALTAYQAADAGLQQALRTQIGDGFSDLVKAVAANDPDGISSAVTAGFKLLDANVDGLLTIDELRSALAGKATDGQLLQIITTLDANGDGMVSAIEAQGKSTAERLEYVAGKLDLNNNGTIGGFELLASRYAVKSDALAAELKTQMTALGLKTLTEGQIRAVLNAPAADIASLLAATDANGDGILTQVELDKSRNDRIIDLLIESGQLREQLSTDFSAIDSNLDGKLTGNELQKYLRSELGIVASNDGLKKLISSVDASGNGTISRLDLIAAEVKRQNAMDIAGLIGEADAGKLSDNALGVFGAAIQTATPNYGGYAGVSEAKLERAIAAATGVDRSEFSALGFSDLQTLAKNLGISKGYALGLGENVIDGVLPPAVVDQLGQSTARALGDAITARTGQPVPASTNYSALPEAKLERGIAALLGVSQGAVSLLSKAQLSSVAKSLKLDASYFPAFARGGFHAGGIRLVGEQGPELEVTGPSRIFNARQTAEMLGGGADTAAEVRSLRAAVAELGNALRSIAKHTQQTARRVEFLERWNYDGMPGARA